MLDKQIKKRSAQAQYSVSLQNLDVINLLSEDMRRFVHRKGDWEVFGRGEILKPIFESLQKRLGRSMGGSGGTGSYFSARDAKRSRYRLEGA